MSQVANCPICGSKSKIKEADGQTVYTAVQDEEAFKKIGQLKKVMEKFKAKSEALEIELNELKASL
ncbi:MAG: hypothetical protein NWP64_05780 [Maribacter sp.]|nr:hypothetical protein [Maribacter sp.]